MLGESLQTNRRHTNANNRLDFLPAEEQSLLYALNLPALVFRPTERATHDSYHRDGEADGDHDNVVQHHEELAAQVAAQRRAHVPGDGRGLLVPFHLQLVPVAHEHGVDVVHKVGDGEHDVAAGQPVPVLTGETWNPFRFVHQTEQIDKTKECNTGARPSPPRAADRNLDSIALTWIKAA